MISTMHAMGGHGPSRVSPEDYHNSYSHGAAGHGGGTADAPHSHGAAHFQDIDDRLGTALEADTVPNTGPGAEVVPGGAESVDVTRFHGASAYRHRGE
jgi:hypothetical protein